MVKKKWGSEVPSEEPGHEEACDERSKPQDVTSTWTGREGINLPEEVVPQARRKISSQLPTEGYRRNEIDGRNEHTGARPESVAAQRRADVTMNVKTRLLMTERFWDLRTQPGRAPEAAAVIGVLS
jgi:hypothetical protein